MEGIWAAGKEELLFVGRGEIRCLIRFGRKMSSLFYCSLGLGVTMGGILGRGEGQPWGRPASQVETREAQEQLEGVKL